MFVEIRKRGKIKKYYAVQSVRKGKEVIKIRKYLGKNLSQKELEKKKSEAERLISEQLRHYREIRNPLKFVLSPEEVEQLKTLEAKGAIKISHLKADEWRRFSEIFSYNTNAIEGSTLTQKEVTALIEHRKIPKKSRADIAEAQGVVEAVKFIRKTKEPISLDFIKKLHKIVFKKTKTFAGKFRPKGVEVVIKNASGNIVHRGAPSSRIRQLLQELLKWYSKNKKTYSSVLLAAVVHNQFENIHPFQDGNGRVGRLLLNAILLRHNLPPVNIELSRRQEYYKSLQDYEKTGNIRPTIELILKEYKSLKKQLRK